MAFFLASTWQPTEPTSVPTSQETTTPRTDAKEERWYLFLVGALDLLFDLHHRLQLALPQNLLHLRSPRVNGRVFRAAKKTHCGNTASTTRAKRRSACNGPRAAGP
eukprot:159815-Rhodomonas_salina.3